MLGDDIQKQIHAIDLLQAMSNAIEESIAENAEREDCWHEDQISRDWLKAMVRALRKLGAHQGFANVKIAAYKQSGQLETDHGDVAVQVIVEPQGAIDTIRGYTFLEAKKSHFSSPFQYRAFRQEQLHRVSRGSSQHRYLFYRREALLPEGLYTESLIEWMWRESEFGVRTSACPTYLVPGFPLPLGDATFGIGIPLAMQVFRYCHGWDLELLPPEVETLPIPEGVPFILSISASHNNEGSPEPLRVPETFVELVDDDDSPLTMMNA